MEAKLLKWGNSDAVRIPKPILKELNLKTGDSLYLSREGNKIVITKLSKQYRSLEERFKEYKGNYKPVEMDWGDPVGNEIW